MINEKRFIYRKFIGIEDTLTGKIYKKLPEITVLLNQESERGDKNAEKYFDEKIKNKKIKKKLWTRGYKGITEIENF